ncbi:MAG: hypothetical protein QXN85_00630 [Candidatus Bathyarchaeia archaeon]
MFSQYLKITVWVEGVEVSLFTYLSIRLLLILLLGTVKNAKNLKLFSDL